MSTSTLAPLQPKQGTRIWILDIAIRYTLYALAAESRKNVLLLDSQSGVYFRLHAAQYIQLCSFWNHGSSHNVNITLFWSHLNTRSRCIFVSSRESDFEIKNRRRIKGPPCFQEGWEQYGNNYNGHNPTRFSASQSRVGRCDKLFIRPRKFLTTVRNNIITYHQRYAPMARGIVK